MLTFLIVGRALIRVDRPWLSRFLQVSITRSTASVKLGALLVGPLLQKRLLSLLFLSGAIIGAAVSGSFLFIIGLANSIILWKIIKRRREVPYSIKHYASVMLTSISPE